MSTTSTAGCALLLLLLAALQGFCRADLKLGFYEKTCPGAEALVQKVVHDAYAKDVTVAPGIIRLHFHDCFVRGCDASVLLDSTPSNFAEKDAELNKRLHGFEVVDSAKAAIESVCPGVVSCSDILAFAARESAALAGNIFYEVPGGRRDGVVSLAAEVELNLPAAKFNAAQLIERFAAKKLTPDEMVTLSGAHSLGVAHCSTFTHRLYNFSAASDTDPALSPAYAALMRNTCPWDGKEAAASTTKVWLDLLTPKVLDNQYYSGLQLGFGLLGSDQALMGDADLSAAVEDNAKSAKKWVGKFAKAMVRMGSILELVGQEGEIRANCRVVNGPRPRPAASSK